MPTRKRVSDLTSWVEAGRILEAIDEFYVPEVVMRDNLEPATLGRDANRARLLQNTAGIAEVREHRAERIIVEGENAVVHWIFRFTTHDGTRIDIDQLALQQWDGLGDDARIVAERFVYDSKSIMTGPA